MRQKTDLQKLFLKYGELTCLNLINLAYKKRFYKSMATARSELSAGECETLIKKSLRYLKQLDLNERIFQSYKNGSFIVYNSIDLALSELGETLTLDLLNQCLRYRMDIGMDLFEISSLGEIELEILKKDYDKKIIQELYDGKRSRGKGKKTLERERLEKSQNLASFIKKENSDKDIPNWLKRDEEIQNKARMKTQEMDRKNMEEKSLKDQEERNFQSTGKKRSLDELNRDPDFDQPEITRLNSLDEKKLKNIEIFHNNEKNKEENN